MFGAGGAVPRTTATNGAAAATRPGSVSAGGTVGGEEVCDGTGCHAASVDEAAVPMEVLGEALLANPDAFLRHGDVAIGASMRIEPSRGGVMTRTKSETELLDDAINGKKEGLEWLAAIRAGHVSAGSLASRLLEMVNGPLVSWPHLTPPERTPWGGRRLAEVLKPLFAGFHVGVPDGPAGESWQVSGQKPFPSIIIVNHNGKVLNVPLTIFVQIAPEKLLGRRDAVRFHGEMPYLVKLLNSGSWILFRVELEGILDELSSRSEAGEWAKHLRVKNLANVLDKNNNELYVALKYLIGSLGDDMFGVANQLRNVYRKMVAAQLSVQVHPDSEMAQKLPGARSKTEGWIILEAEEGAGLYLGLKEGVTGEEFERVLRGGEDVSQFLNFVEVHPGDVFFIPAGTPHAVGAGIFLIEPQETSETTFRFYDWGRLDAQGKPRRLDVNEALTSTKWNGLRGDAFVAAIRREPISVSLKNFGTVPVETLLEEDQFAVRKVVLDSGAALYKGVTADGVVSLTVVLGIATVVINGKDYDIRQGQSMIIPAAVGKFEVKRKIGEQKGATVMETKSSGF